MSYLFNIRTSSSGCKSIFVLRYMGLSSLKKALTHCQLCHCFPVCRKRNTLVLFIMCYSIMNVWKLECAAVMNLLVIRGEEKKTAGCWSSSPFKKDAKGLSWEINNVTKCIYLFICLLIKIMQRKIKEKLVENNIHMLTKIEMYTMKVCVYSE